MKYIRYILALIGLTVFLVPQNLMGQEHFFKDRKLRLNEDGSNYIKLAFLTQAWVRQQEYNPGTTINGVEKSSGADIGIRRYRVQLYGQLTDRVFAYSQFGENNFSSISDRKQGFFVHDAYGEYAIDKKKLSIGMGISGWSGLSRFASPSAGSIMGIDTPLYQQTTNDVTDQFLRKLSVFAKGKLGKLDYRIAIADPMTIQKSIHYNPEITEYSTFSHNPPNMQWNGYFQYQFKDQESNLTPYMAGTYLGKRKVFNIGTGFIFQKEAMWHLNVLEDDVVHTDMLHLSTDIFYDAPIGLNGQAISLYGNVTHSDFGKNYIRNSGAMNPANGNNNPIMLNRGGNSFPMYGTGTILYAQAGYKFKDNLIGNTTLMPYASLQSANYERLNARMNFVDVGLNWLLSEHASKFTLSYQNRPVYDVAGDQIDRRGAFVAQYQVSFN